MASPNYDILRFLSEYRGKSISQSFEDQLTNSLNIREGIRAIASTSQQNLREFLQSECDARLRVSRQSSAEQTATFWAAPLHDTQRHARWMTSIYTCHWTEQISFTTSAASSRPAPIVTNRSPWNPLLTPRWAIGSYVSSTKLIDEFAVVLKRRFPQTKVKPNGQAVSVRMTHGETLSSDGLGYDVVPCFSLSPHQQEDRQFYLMPDGKGDWMRTIRESMPLAPTYSKKTTTSSSVRSSSF